MNKILAILYISRYGIMSFLKWKTRHIGSFTKYQNAPKDRLEETTFSEGVIDIINFRYGELYTIIPLGFYIISFINLFGTCLSLNFHTISLLWFLTFFPVEYVLLFLFTDKKLKQWNARIDKHIKKKGHLMVNVITSVYVLCSVPIFCLSLHILSVFGNPAG